MNETNVYDEEIDLRDLWQVFRRNFVVILIAIVVGGVAAAGVCHHIISPKYTATSKLYVVSASNNSVVNLSDLQLGSSLASDYKELILSRPVMESAIMNQNLSMTVEQLQNSIEITNPSGTRILCIDVTTDNAELSKRIANEIANLSVSWLPATMESSEPNIVEEAVTPTVPSSPHYKRNIIIGAVGCGILVYGIILISFFFNNTVVSGEDMEKYFGMTPMAVIPFEGEISRTMSQNSNGKSSRHATSGGSK